MVIVMICEKYGWDYLTYMKQPSWFIYLILEKHNIDARKEQDEVNKAKHQM